MHEYLRAWAQANYGVCIFRCTCHSHVCVMIIKTKNPYNKATQIDENEEKNGMWLSYTTTVEPLYYGHPWDHMKCPD